MEFLSIPELFAGRQVYTLPIPGIGILQPGAREGNIIREEE